MQAHCITAGTRARAMYRVGGVQSRKIQALKENHDLESESESGSLLMFANDILACESGCIGL